MMLFFIIAVVCVFSQNTEYTCPSISDCKDPFGSSLTCPKYKLDWNNCRYCNCFGKNCPHRECFDLKMCEETKYRIDPRTGCRICSCVNENYCPDIVGDCKTVYNNSVNVGNNCISQYVDPQTGCETCHCNPSTGCGDIVCEKKCERYMIQDGCQTCNCWKKDCPATFDGFCNLKCPYGFEFDPLTGCRLCKCRCLPLKSCPEICPFGREITSASGDLTNSCPLCKCKTCTEKCVDNGHKIDTSGNRLCDCEEEKCAPVTCKMYCEFGWAIDKRGCEICECHQCPQVKCQRFCKEYKKDKRGCPTCDCVEDPVFTCDRLCKYGYQRDPTTLFRKCDCNICPISKYCQYGVLSDSRNEERKYCQCRRPNIDDTIEERPCIVPPRDCTKRCLFGYALDATTRCPKLCECRGKPAITADIPDPVPCKRKCRFGFCYVPIGLINRFTDDGTYWEELKKNCIPFPPRKIREKYRRICMCLPNPPIRKHPKIKRRVDPNCRWPPCKMYCEHGYKITKNDDGSRCPICECRTKPTRDEEFEAECKVPECDRVCEYGFKLDEYGCVETSCECAYGNSSTNLMNFIYTFDPQSKGLVIGLSVGIPVTVLVLLILIALTCITIVYCIIKKRKEYEKVSEEVNVVQAELDEEKNSEKI